MYTYANGSEIEVARDCIERETCCHMAFERVGLEVLVDGKRVGPGNYHGRLEIRGDDCKLVMARAEIRWQDDVLVAQEED